MLMSSGESLCIMDATNSVVPIRFCGVAVLAEIMLIIFLLLGTFYSIVLCSLLFHYNSRATKRFKP